MKLLQGDRLPDKKTLPIIIAAFQWRKTESIVELTKKYESHNHCTSNPSLNHYAKLKQRQKTK